MKYSMWILAVIVCGLVIGCTAQKAVVQQPVTPAAAAQTAPETAAVAQTAVGIRADAAGPLGAPPVEVSAVQAAALSQAIKVEEAVFCTAVKDRIPQGTAESFDPAVKKVFFFTRVEGAANPAVVTHVWYWNEKKMAEIPLDVRSTNWRTWSSKRIDPSWKGSWAVKVLDEKGDVLTTKTFVIQ